MIKTLIPEIFLSSCILMQIVYNSFILTKKKYNFPILDHESVYQLGFILCCLILLTCNSKLLGYDIMFLWVTDESVITHKVLFLILCLFVLIIIAQSYIIQKINFFEYFTFYLFSILSSMLLFSVGDLLTAYLVFELQALAFYVLANIKTNSLASSEAGIKYFIVGAFTSAIFLFGCSILYVTFGTLNLNQLALLFSFPFTSVSVESAAFEANKLFISRFELAFAIEESRLLKELIDIDSWYAFAELNYGQSDVLDNFYLARNTLCLENFLTGLSLRLHSGYDNSCIGSGSLLLEVNSGDMVVKVLEFCKSYYSDFFKAQHEVAVAKVANLHAWNDALVNGSFTLERNRILTAVFLKNAALDFSYVGAHTTFFSRFLIDAVSFLEANLFVDHATFLIDIFTRIFSINDVSLHFKLDNLVDISNKSTNADSSDSIKCYCLAEASIVGDEFATKVCLELRNIVAGIKLLNGLNVDEIVSYLIIKLHSYSNLLYQIKLDRIININTAINEFSTANSKLDIALNTTQLDITSKINYLNESKKYNMDFVLIDQSANVIIDLHRKLCNAFGSDYGDSVFNVLYDAFAVHDDIFVGRVLEIGSFITDAVNSGYFDSVAWLIVAQAQVAYCDFENSVLLEALKSFNFDEDSNCFVTYLFGILIKPILQDYNISLSYTLLNMVRDFDVIISNLNSEACQAIKAFKDSEVVIAETCVEKLTESFLCTNSLVNYYNSLLMVESAEVLKDSVAILDLSHSIVPASTTLHFFGYFGALCIIISLFLKLAVAPFHFWAPDVYDGAPLSSTIIFSILPKLPVFHFFIKWIGIVTLFENLSLFFIISAVLSICVGTFMALSQKHVKRLIIYSSIAQTGFLLLALANYSSQSLISLYFYLIIYLITALILWNKVSLFYSFQNNLNKFYKKSLAPLQITDLTNLYLINPLWAFSFLIILFSIAGIPPFSGFYSKFLILLSLIDLNLLAILFLIIILSIVSTFYYLRLVKIIFFEPKKLKILNNSALMIFPQPFLLVNCLINSFLLFLLIFFFIYPNFLMLCCYNLILSSHFF